MCSRDSHSTDDSQNNGCHCGLVSNTLAYTEDVGSIPGTGRYIVARMTTKNGGPLSLGLIPSGRLKNLKDVDKWSSLRPYLSVGGMSVILELDPTCTVGWVTQSFMEILL